MGCPDIQSQYVTSVTPPPRQARCNPRPAHSEFAEIERLQRENAELRRDETRQERDDLRIRRNELEAKLAAAEAALELKDEAIRHHMKVAAKLAKKRSAAIRGLQEAHVRIASQQYQSACDVIGIALVESAIDAAKTEVQA